MLPRNGVSDLRDPNAAVVQPAFDVAVYRKALSNVATGVAIVTAKATSSGLPRQIGITVNSFTSISLDPPLVLWSLNSRSYRYVFFKDAAVFTISILTIDNKSESVRLATPGVYSFDENLWCCTQLGPAALKGAAAIFECTKEQLIEIGDHTLVIGRVLRFSHVLSRHPLVFYRGNYGTVVPITTPDSASERS
jgi:flavin reductase (DIM6/NTAB) family NADH-FMN oxidoreductase RutF